MTDYIELNSPAWRVAAASVAGLRHVRNAAPCQDNHAWALLPEGAFAAVVADGAGSAELGGTGSAIASRAALDSIQGTSCLPRDAAGLRSLLTRALTHARDAVVLEAVRLERDPRDLATTLIVLIATRNVVAAAQIGDGASVIDTPNGVVAVTAPVLGEYINETTFVVSPNAIETAQYNVLYQPCLSLALFSDGLQMLALKLVTGDPFAPFFQPLFQFAAGADEPGKAATDLAAWLASPRVSARTDDDVTLVLAHRLAGATDANF